MTADGRLSRRDFLRLRKTERGNVLEVSCRAMFMRCADATIVSAGAPIHAKRICNHYMRRRAQR